VDAFVKASTHSFEFGTVTDSVAAVVNFRHSATFKKWPWKPWAVNTPQAIEFASCISAIAICVLSEQHRLNPPILVGLGCHLDKLELVGQLQQLPMQQCTPLSKKILPNASTQYSTPVAGSVSPNTNNPTIHGEKLRGLLYFRSVSCVTAVVLGTPGYV